MNGRWGGVAVIYSRALSNTKLSPVDLNVSSFEYMEVVINKNRSVMLLAVVYRLGHLAMD